MGSAPALRPGSYGRRVNNKFQFKIAVNIANLLQQRLRFFLTDDAPVTAAPKLAR